MQDSLGRSNRGWAPDEPVTATHYTVTLPPQSASYVVKTWADSAKDAADVVQAVLKSAPQAAKDAQERAGAPELSRYTAFVTAATQTEELPPQSPVKLLLTMVAIGAIAGAALSLLIERVLPKRSKARPTPRSRPTRIRRRAPAAGTNRTSAISDHKAEESHQDPVDGTSAPSVEPAAGHRESVKS
jgi:hypothetical protein